MFLEGGADALELVVGGGQVVLELGHRLGRAHAGDDVLALGVHEELAVELLDAVGGIAGEGDAGAGLVAGVAVHHGLHVDGRAPVGGDVVLAAVDDRTVIHPRAEDGADGTGELVPWTGGKIVAGALLHEGLETDDELLEVVGGELGVLKLGVAVAFLLEATDDGLERLMILVRALLHAKHDVAIHLDEAAVAIPRKTRVGGLFGEGLDGLVVETEVEDGVHHARHGIARAGADGNKQRVDEVAKLHAGLFLDGADTGFDLRLERGWVAALAGVVVGADLRGNREARGHGQADAAHLGEVGAFATEEGLHRAVAVGLPAEQVDVFLDFAGRGLPGRGDGFLGFCFSGHVDE